MFEETKYLAQRHSIDKLGKRNIIHTARVFVTKSEIKLNFLEVRYYYVINEMMNEY